MLCGQARPRVDASRQMQIAEQTFYRRVKQYGGMGTDQLKALKRLQKENDRLRRAVSDLTLDKLILSDAAGWKRQRPSRLRACIDHIRNEMRVSERRVCRVLGQHRSTQRRLSGYCESFNARFRDTMLNGETVYSLSAAEIIIESWRQHDNTERPHSALGYRPPTLKAIAPVEPGPIMH